MLSDKRRYFDLSLRQPQEMFGCCYFDSERIWKKYVKIKIYKHTSE